MKYNPTNLIAIVSKSLGRELDMKVFEDRLAVQKGTYILNSWGVGPIYEYTKVFRGPYSIDLDDDCCELDSLDTSKLEASPELVSRLSEIYGKGDRYTDAYATVLMVKNNNPHEDGDCIRYVSLKIEPELEKEIQEASTLLLT